MSSPTPREHIEPYMWEIGEGARTAIIGHNNQWHVLVACDIYESLIEAARRLAEIEQHFDQGQADQPQWVTDLIAAARQAQPFVDAVAPSTIVHRFDEALRKVTPGAA